MKTTSNYGLMKPDGTDIVDIQNFNDNADKIDIALKVLSDGSYPTVDATGTNDYVATCSAIKVLNKSTKLTLFVSTDATGNCTINLNSFGAKSIKDSFGNVVKNLKTNIPYNLCYNGTDFILQGKGGGGNAKPEEILSGKTATNDSGQIIGTMANNGQINATLNAGQSKTIPAGYTSGGTVSVNSLASQTDSTATENDMLEGKTAYVKGTKLTGTIKSYGTITEALSLGNDNENKGIYPRIPRGAYLQNADFGNPEIHVPYSMVANTIGLKPEQIVKGNNILGISGTAILGTGNAKAEEVLSGRTFTNSSGASTGTMVNRGAITANLNNDQVYTIPQGYHNGDGKVTVSSLGSQTSGNATSAQILQGYNAWVNGEKIDGNIVDRGGITTSLNAEQVYTIPQGYHNGQGRVTANSLSSQGATKIFIGKREVSVKKGQSIEELVVDIGFKPTTIFARMDSSNSEMSSYSTDVDWLTHWWANYIGADTSSSKHPITGVTETGFTWSYWSGNLTEDKTFKFDILAFSIK